MKNPDATFAFINHTQTARESVRRLTELLDDHAGVSPDDCNWADVGTMGHLVELLANIETTFELDLYK